MDHLFCPDHGFLLFQTLGVSLIFLKGLWIKFSFKTTPNQNPPRNQEVNEVTK